jgi:hypothetical protein
MHTETQAGSAQCMHCIFMNDCLPPSAYTLMMFLVLPFRSEGAS